MSNRQTFGAAFLGGLVGSNRSLQRWVARFAWRILLGILMLPLVVLTWLNVPPALAVRLTAAFWVGLLGLLLIRVVMRWVAPWVARALDGTSVKTPRLLKTNPFARDKLHLTLYRYREPADLPSGLRCSCGKPRTPGECVYVGKTIRGVEQRTVEHQDDRHWMQPELVLDARMDFADEDALAKAERDAYDYFVPRENGVRPSDKASRRVTS